MGYNYPGEFVDLGGNRGWLDRLAAESIWRIDRALGHLLQITEAGRSWDQQNEHWMTYLRNGWPIALNPDTPSEHQKGKAIDSNEAQRILRVMEDHGWRRTVYRWVNGKWTLVEEWHFEHFPHLDNHRNEGRPAGNQSEEDAMNPAQERKLDSLATDVANIKGFLYHGGESVTDPNYVPAPGSVLQVVRNIAAHAYSGGVDAAKPEYLAAPGTIYHLLKRQVLRSNKSRPTALPEDGTPVLIEQIQDQADTQTLVRELVTKVESLSAEVRRLTKPTLATA